MKRMLSASLIVGVITALFSKGYAEVFAGVGNTPWLHFPVLWGMHSAAIFIFVFIVFGEE